MRVAWKEPVGCNFVLIDTQSITELTSSIIEIVVRLGDHLLPQISVQVGVCGIEGVGYCCKVINGFRHFASI